MSVAATKTARIVPVRGSGRSTIIGRWIGSVSLAGDGSAGVYTLSIVLSGIGALLGPFTLWDIQFYDWVLGAIVNPSGKITITPWETLESGGSQYQIGLSMYQGAAMGPTQFPNIHRCLFRTSDVPAVNTALSLEVSPNTNGETVYFFAQGNIHDERLF